MVPGEFDFTDTMINVHVEEVTWADYVAACEQIKERDFENTVKLDLDNQDFECPET